MADYYRAFEEQILESQEAVAEKEVIAVCAADITLKPVRWLWRGWLACGKLHIIAGQPGCGKSTLAFSLASLITTGGAWPDGTLCTDDGNVLIWSGEDSADDTIVPRLKAADADLERIFIVKAVKNGESHRPFEPTKDLAELGQLMEKLQPRMLIVDSIVSAVGGDSHKNTETRRGLQPLVDLAEAHGTAVVGITHFTKGTSGRDPLERVTGSLAFGALPRVVLVAAKLKPGNKYGVEHLFARAKSNIGPNGGGFAYELAVVSIEGCGAIETILARWGNAINDNAREMLEDSVDSDRTAETGLLADAKIFLSDFLRDGPRLQKDIIDAARDNGISPATVRRAKSVLGIKAKKGGMKNGWSWELPAHLTVVEENKEPW